MVACLALSETADIVALQHFTVKKFAPFTTNAQQPVRKHGAIMENQMPTGSHALKTAKTKTWWPYFSKGQAVLRILSGLVLSVLVIFSYLVLWPRLFHRALPPRPWILCLLIVIGIAALTYSELERLYRSALNKEQLAKKLNAAEKV